jgi:hypothetical protein
MERGLSGGAHGSHSGRAACATTAERGELRVRAWPARGAAAGRLPRIEHVIAAISTSVDGTSASGCAASCWSLSQRALGVRLLHVKYAIFSRADDTLHVSPKPCLDRFCQLKLVISSRRCRALQDVSSVKMAALQMANSLAARPAVRPALRVRMNTS